jgi:DNA-binding NtrC family response regulator
MAQSDTPRRRILVVDDEQDIIDILQEHLATTYDVTSARDGTRALELVHATRPDLIFLDVAMPGVNGMDVLKAVKELDPTIAIIAITANADTSLAAEVINRGAFSYLPKPFDLRYLEHLAASALSR